MGSEVNVVVSGVALDEDTEVTLAELCQGCAIHAELVAEMVDQGIIEPRGSSAARWRFPAPSVRRVHAVVRMQRDLGVNLAGAALALELLDEIRQLRVRTGLSRGRRLQE